MKKISIAVLFCIGLLSAPMPAMSLDNDPPIGSRLGNRTQAGEAVSKERAIRNAHDYARCIYFSRGRTVVRFLNALDDNAYNNASKEVFKSIECETQESIDPNLDSFGVYSSPSSMRGLLAEEALRQDGKLNAKSPILPILPLAPGYARSWFAMTERPTTVDPMSVCFAETNPALVVSLLATKPSSTEEKSAIGEIVGLLGPCLIGGAQLKANIFTLRASLAEAYFHRIYGPVEAPMETEK